MSCVPFALSRDVGGIDGFRSGRATRFAKRFGFAVAGLGLFELFTSKAHAGMNIYSHPPKAQSAYRMFIGNYEAALAEATGTSGRLSYNTAVTLKDSFIAYLNALELGDNDAATAVEVTMDGWIQLNTHP